MSQSLFIGSHAFPMNIRESTTTYYHQNVRTISKTLISNHVMLGFPNPSLSRCNGNLADDNDVIGVKKI